jgi:hypothetical protein
VLAVTRIVFAATKAEVAAKQVTRDNYYKLDKNVVEIEPSGGLL